MLNILEGIAKLIFVVIVGAVLAAGYLVYRLVEATVQAIDRAWGDTLYLIAGGVSLAVFVLVAVGGALALVRWMVRRSRHVHARDGLFPVIDAGGGRYVNVNETGAQSLAVAMSAGRLSAPTAGRIIDAHYKPFDAAQQVQPVELPSAPLTVADLANVSPRTDPHWLLVGAPGSGKTSASYAILSAMIARSMCEFVVCELGGVHWPGAASTVPEIVRAVTAVDAELMRRLAMLRDAGMEHNDDLPDPQPLLVLLAEELDSTLQELPLAVGRDERRAFVASLRKIASMGRKAGISLFAVSTSGTSDVFDGHVRKSVSNVLLFRSEHTVGDAWRLPGVRLNDMPTGMAYSVRHGATVRFTQSTRPRLPLARLAEPAEPDAILAPDWPRQAPEPAVLGGSDWFSRLSAGSWPVLGSNEEPPAELAAQMQDWYASGVTMNEIRRRVWPAKNGVIWNMLQSILSDAPPHVD